MQIKKEMEAEARPGLPAAPQYWLLQLASISEPLVTILLWDWNQSEFIMTTANSTTRLKGGVIWKIALSFHKAFLTNNKLTS